MDELLITYLVRNMWYQYGCSREGLVPGAGPPKPCANLVLGGVGPCARGGGSDLVPGRGARPCAGHLCEDLVPGTFAVILIKLRHSATVCKSSAEMKILRHVPEARYYQVL